MEHLEAALEGKRLTDLRPAEKAGGSNPIRPTKAEIEEVFASLKAGKSEEEIKQACVRNRGDASKPQLSLSFSQIRRIRAAWEAKIVELTPKEEA